jgi:hypothetical protein
MTHDYDSQKAETFKVFGQLSRKHKLPAEAAVEYQFIPVEDEADWSAFEKAARALGHATKRFEDEDYIEIITKPVLLNAETIWEHELALTEIALETGFIADGWGFVA